MVELQCDRHFDYTVEGSVPPLLQFTFDLRAIQYPDELLGIGSDQRLHNSQETMGFIFAYFIPQPRLRSYKPDQHSALKQGELRREEDCIVMGYDFCCSVTPIFLE